MQPTFDIAFDANLDVLDLSKRLMWITPDRIFYAGLLGTTSVRVMGALIIYVALEDSIGIGIRDREPQICDLAVVPPYVPHRITSDTRLIAALQLEAETLDMTRLPAPLNAMGPVDAPWFVERVRRSVQELCVQALSPSVGSHEFDRMFFDQPLVPRPVDHRIVEVISGIKRSPSEQSCAVACASAVHLSCTRFRHLFTQELGVPFRSFRAWKRARSLLHYLNMDSQLTNIALDIGYPDSSYFSHSIRQMYGLSPKDMLTLTKGIRFMELSTKNIG
ncbi:AraC family transcriptional regulator [Pseudomonas sp. MWU12-2312b]|uniref:helix-turn-helix domain-containing protein n=1 Tax=Pseudomonas moorei TaxID=395599 RepID=UPI000D41F615|nr:AraC family transcriptional regulator [Pseudomonas moorei]PPA02313.1 AraC family transcriptional regulator [Pseudomonas sp. MWU12-2312b]